MSTTPLNNEIRRKLYDYFLADTPIKFESVTEEQFQHMAKTYGGTMVILGHHVNKVGKEVSKAMDELAKDFIKYFKTEGKRKK